ncbi:MAG: ArgR family transcriptional regulator [Candidatus Dormibacteraeota bacterium]|nr:ArgR family transcriptional regulator [Candidatus Dormibacteraeota bacterium]
MAILSLVASRRVQTQQELTDGLAEMGLPTTQATVSRDIQELGLARTKTGYKPVLFTDYVLSVTSVEFLTVIRTSVGCANLVARAIDERELPGVVGTLAGDDTIIVVHPDPTLASAFKRFLQ